MLGTGAGKPLKPPRARVTEMKVETRCYYLTSARVLLTGGAALGGMIAAKSGSTVRCATRFDLIQSICGFSDPDVDDPQQVSNDAEATKPNAGSYCRLLRFVTQSHTKLNLCAQLHLIAVRDSVFKRHQTQRLFCNAFKGKIGCQLAAIFTLM